MSQYTNQKPINEQAWMDSLLSQISKKINEGQHEYSLDPSRQTHHDEFSTVLSNSAFLIQENDLKSMLIVLNYLNIAFEKIKESQRKQSQSPVSHPGITELFNKISAEIKRQTPPPLPK